MEENQRSGADKLRERDSEGGVLRHAPIHLKHGAQDAEQSAHPDALEKQKAHTGRWKLQDFG